MKLIANHVLLNHAAASQSNIGWHNFLKGSISDEWATLWTKSMGAQTAKACEFSLFQALWDHTYILWTFRNNEDHKKYNGNIAQYKKQSIDVQIAQQYHTFQHNDLPLNVLQQTHFRILQEELLLLSYDIHHAWLRSADLYISRATAHNDLAHGNHAQHILHNTSGRPPDT
jgi:hypothetical protein